MFLYINRKSQDLSNNCSGNELRHFRYEMIFSVTSSIKTKLKFSHGRNKIYVEQNLYIFPSRLSAM